jgi:hypothetical protein
MRRGASTAIVLTLTIIVAIILVGGCTRPKPTEESLVQEVASPTIEAPPGATVVAVEATPTLVPPGEMPADLTLTLHQLPPRPLPPLCLGSPPIPRPQPRQPRQGLLVLPSCTLSSAARTSSVLP